MGLPGLMALLSLAELPALPLHTAGKYVAGAYIVAFLIVLIYVAIMAIRLSHMERDLGELLELTEHPRRLHQQAPGGHEHPDLGGRETSAGHDTSAGRETSSV
jgi:hypothetical protein